MSRHVQERQARYMLWVIGLTALCYAILGALVGFGGPTPATFGLFGLGGFAGLIGRRERRQGKVFMDERDKEIARAATLAAFSVFWVCFVLACMTPIFVLGPNGVLTMPVTLLCDAVFVALPLVFGVRSLVIVILYRRGRDGTDD
ncbi:MAG: hypothetical protein NTW86_18590 [Candidatus Sumerlaeota bacterium]|nr:hypothetical protein [Candidatus Sumerlaeota bacterium]